MDAVTGWCRSAARRAAVVPLRRLPRGAARRAVTAVLRLRDEDGVALPVAVTALALVSTLVAVGAAGAVSLSDSSNRDRDSKRALAAAEAGLQAANYRTNKLNPAAGSCVTDRIASPTSGECPGFTEQAGNGASYSYHVSLPLPAGDQCAGQQIQLLEGGQQAVTQRCITSTGTVNGIKRRVQSRVASYTGTSLFPLAGSIGKRGVLMKNSAEIAGAIGSNGVLEFKNGADATRVELGPSGSAIYGNSSTVGQTVQRTAAQGPFVLSNVDVGDAGTNNDNARISTGLDASQNVTYVPATHMLTLGNSSSLTLGGGATGTYHFCSVKMTNSAHITIAARARVRIFIDSPARSGSICPSTASNADSGRLIVGNSADFVTPSGDPRDLQLYVWGSPVQDENVVSWENSHALVGSLYAPQSRVVFKNSATVRGGVAADYIEMQNSVDITWDERLVDLRARTVAVHYRTAWRECRPDASTPSDPESGC